MAKHAFLVEKMWYVVETEAGKEQAFINIIEKTIEHRSFKRCFFVKRERLRRQQERCCVYREILYPGYVFVDTEEPNAFCGEVERLQQFIGSPSSASRSTTATETARGSTTFPMGTTTASTRCATR